GPSELDERAIFAFAVDRTHRCGSLVCNFSRYEIEGRDAFVQWDLRDRGTVVEVHDPVVEAQNARCREATGSESLSQCLQSCWASGADLIGGEEDAICRARCAGSCR